MAKKYQVFVSSTFRDLVDERQDAIRNILDLNHIPAGMELFPATDQDQLNYIKKVIDECDYYLLIVGGRYGSVDGDGISYTEREYDYALETGKPVLAFVHNDPSSIPVGKSDIAPHVAEALEKFKAKVMQGRLVKGWTTRQNLEPVVLKALIHVFNDLPQVGWIRADTAASENLLAQSNALLQENASLKEKLSEFDHSSPDLDNLAGLDEKFLVRYTHGDVRSRYTSTKEFTWADLAIGFAHALPQTKWTYGIVDDAVSFAFQSANTPKKSISVNSVDKERMLVQMEALGIVRSGMAQSQKGPAPTLTLTPKGREMFIQAMAVRSERS